MKKDPEVTRRRMRLPAGFRVLSFFLSGLFFLSGFLTFLAPWPLLYVYLKSGRVRALLFLAANAVLVAGMKATANSAEVSLAWTAFYGAFVFSVVVPAGEMIRARRSLEATGIVTILGMAATMGLALLILARTHGHTPRQEIDFQIQQFTTAISERVTDEKIIPQSDRELWIKQLPEQIPSSLAILMLLVVWVNLVPALRLNPGGYREKMGLPPAFIQLWRAPDWLVWPTILCGFFLVYEVPAITPTAVTGLNVLLCIYGIQGLSILSFFFHRWKLMAGFRLFGFFMAVFMFLPMLLALGFFDLWFDFRKKFRQS